METRFACPDAQVEASLGWDTGERTRALLWGRVMVEHLLL